MLDFGTSGSHGNAVEFTDAAYGDVLDGLTQYFMIFGMRPRVAGWTNTTRIFSKLVSTAGWTLQAINSAGNNKIRMTHGSGGTTASYGDSTTNFTSGTSYLVGVWWNGTIARYYINGVSEGDVAFTKAIDPNAVSFFLGNQDGLASGAQVALGPMAIWRSALSDADVAQAFAGISLPAASQLVFFHRGIDVPGTEETRSKAGVERGTVDLLTDATLDNLYPPSLKNPTWRAVASHRLLRRRTEEPIFAVRCNDWVISIDPMTMVALAHDSLPVVASRVAGQLPGQSLSQLIVSQPWRRRSARFVMVDDDPLERAALVRFKDHEGFGATYWSTDRLPEGSSDDLAGLARLDLAADWTVTRASKAYLEQDNSILEEALFNSDGQFMRVVGAFREKANHIGTLYEEASDNVVLNSDARGSETSWTSVDNSGTTDLSTTRLAFPRAVTGQSFRYTRPNNASDTYREQTFAVLSADGFRRLYCIHTEQNAGSVTSLRLQRSSDSFYWNDSTGAWQAGATWIRLPNGYDGTVLRPRFGRFVSKAIPISSNQNWTLRQGLEGAALPAGGGEVNVYCLSALKGYLRFSELPDSAAAGVVDLVVGTKTALPQQVPADRFTLSLELVAVQAGGDLADNDQLVLAEFEYGTTGGSNYNVDRLVYQKLPATNVRFAWERWLAGALSARATKEVTIVPGTTYRIAAVATGSADADLELAAHSLRIYVDGVAGVDAAASANQDPAQATTYLRKGWSNYSGYKRAMNYLREWKVWTRCLVAEELP